jgi:hypothetical protein
MQIEKNMKYTIDNRPDYSGHVLNLFLDDLREKDGLFWSEIQKKIIEAIVELHLKNHGQGLLDSLDKEEIANQVSEKIANLLKEKICGSNKEA